MNKAQYYEQVLMMARAVEQVFSQLAPRGVFKLEEFGPIDQLAKASTALIAATEAMQMEEADEAEEG